MSKKKEVMVKNKSDKDLKMMKEIGKFIGYGIFWCIVIVCVGKITNGVRVYKEQKQKIEELIERLKEYEEIDFIDKKGNEKEKEGNGEESIIKWVKENLPSEGKEERKDVAAVFIDLAAKLEAGELKGERDTFAEGIAQLQPVCTRRIWLPFLTKLTKRLKKEKLEGEALAVMCRAIGAAIYPKAKERPSKMLIDGIWKEDFIREELKREIKEEEKKTEEEQKKKEEAKNCNNGTCQNQNNKQFNRNGYGYGYGNYYGGYGGYWLY